MGMTAPSGVTWFDTQRDRGGCLHPLPDLLVILRSSRAIQHEPASTSHRQHRNSLPQ